MKKIGAFWVPKIDTHWFRNRTKTEANFRDGQMGRDIGNLDGALTAIRHHTTPDLMQQSVAIDAGANIGAYAWRMAGEFAKVYAFEPADDTFACLARNVDEWALRDVILPYQMAVSDRREGVAMGSNGFLRRSVSREVVGEGDTPAVPLDEFGLNDLLFLKLDVEGFELKALLGTAETIARCRPFVMMELKDRHIKSGRANTSAVDWLEEQGYTVIANLGDPVIDRLYAPRERIKKVVL